MLASYIISSVLIAVMAKYLLEGRFLGVSVGSEGNRSSPAAGRKLYDELLGLNRIYLASGKAIELTRYKFFTELLDELLVSYRSNGANIFTHVLDVRKNLLEDLKTEKKIGAICRGSYSEMVVVTLLGLCFVLFAVNYADVKIPLSSCFLAFGWQGLGALVFMFLQRACRKRVFCAFADYVRAASKLDLYLKLNRPVNLIADELALANLPKDRSLNHLRERMEEILKLVKHRGGHDGSQTRELGMECWFCHDQKLEEFMRRIKSLKLLILMLFFLSGYLFLFYSLVEGLGVSL